MSTHGPNRHSPHPGRVSTESRHIDARYLAAVKEYDAAVRLMQKEKFDKAKETFEKLANSPVREVADRALIHLRVCEQRLNALSRTPPTKSAEDLYNLGVFALNARNPEAAVEHLSKADKLKPHQEHIRYALASAHAHLGNTEAALDHLSAAIELRPQNRTRARLDEEFQSLAEEPRFRKLVNLE